MMRLDHLPNQEPEEKVELFLRRHWIDLVKVLLFSGVLFIVPLVIIALIGFTGSDMLEGPVWGPIGIVLLSSYLLMATILTITQITDYWLDVWIVTNERIINIEQHGLFKRLISEVRLEQIQDITSETLGLLETFLTLGDVYIQTAANRERFQFKNVDNPDDIKTKIYDLVNTCRLSHKHAHAPLAAAIAPSTPSGK